MPRAQLSLTLVEATVGVAFVLSVAAVFTVGVPAPDARAIQLDTYADDVATVLAGEPPRHGDATRLAELTASSGAFERERDALARRVGRVVPENLLYRVETPHGSVGYRVPTGVTVGVARVPTAGGPVVVRVWYA